jgi:hypothetical protein
VFKTAPHWIQSNKSISHLHRDYLRIIPQRKPSVQVSGLKLRAFLPSHACSMPGPRVIVLLDPVSVPFMYLLLHAYCT